MAKAMWNGVVLAEAEETVEGDVVAFGGNVTAENSSTIDGNMVVFGGNVDEHKNSCQIAQKKE